LSSIFSQIAADLKALMPRVDAPIVLTASYTFVLSDSGKSFIYNLGSDITVSFPQALPDGFHVDVYQANVGRVILDLQGRLDYNNATRQRTQFGGDFVVCKCAHDNGVPILFITFHTELPITYTISNAALTRNATTMVAVPGVAQELEANSVYDVDYQVTFSSAITTNALKLGFAALPSGATCQLEGVIYNTNVAGTAQPARKTLLTSAEAVTGVLGASSVTTGVLLGRVTGRITTAGTAGTLTPTAGSIATTGNISVAAGAATLKLGKIK
jgi:hypothetical protein